MSCLFNSLSYFFNEKSFDIRQKICDYLKQNNPIIDGLDTLFILNLERIRKQKYFGSHWTKIQIRHPGFVLKCFILFFYWLILCTYLTHYIHHITDICGGCILHEHLKG